MATKRAAKKSAKKTAKKGGRKKSVLQTARREVQQLLKQEQAGTLTRRELEAGLKEIAKHLEVMDVFIHSSL